MISSWGIQYKKSHLTTDGIFPEKLQKLVGRECGFENVPTLINYFTQSFPKIFPSEKTCFSKLCNYLTNTFNVRRPKRKHRNLPEWGTFKGKLAYVSQKISLVKELLDDIFSECDGGEVILHRSKRMVIIANPLEAYTLLYDRHHRDPNKEKKITKTLVKMTFNYDLLPRNWGNWN